MVWYGMDAWIDASMHANQEDTWYTYIYIYINYKYILFRSSGSAWSSTVFLCRLDLLPVHAWEISKDPCLKGSPKAIGLAQLHFETTQLTRYPLCLVAFHSTKSDQPHHPTMLCRHTQAWCQVWMALRNTSASSSVLVSELKTGVKSSFMVFFSNIFCGEFVNNKQIHWKHAIVLGWSEWKQRNHCALGSASQTTALPRSLQGRLKKLLKPQKPHCSSLVRHVLFISQTP